MITAVVGHIFPFHLEFRGGKGSATAIGIFIHNSAVEIVAGRFGLASFVAILVVALVIYLASRAGDVAGMVTFTFKFVVTPLVIGAVLASATELFSFKVDDNFTVSLVSGGALTALGRFVGL